MESLREMNTKCETYICGTCSAKLLNWTLHIRYSEWYPRVFESICHSFIHLFHEKKNWNVQRHTYWHRIKLQSLHFWFILVQWTHRIWRYFRLDGKPSQVASWGQTVGKYAVWDSALKGRTWEEAASLAVLVSLQLAECRVQTMLRFFYMF